MVSPMAPEASATHSSLSRAPPRTTSTCTVSPRSTALAGANHSARKAVPVAMARSGTLPASSSTVLTNPEAGTSCRVFTRTIAAVSARPLLRSCAAMTRAEATCTLTPAPSRKTGLRPYGGEGSHRPGYAEIAIGYSRKVPALRQTAQLGQSKDAHHAGGGGQAERSFRRHRGPLGEPSGQIARQNPVARGAHGEAAGQCKCG